MTESTFTKNGFTVAFTDHGPSQRPTVVVNGRREYVAFSRSHAEQWKDSLIRNGFVKERH